MYVYDIYSKTMKGMLLVVMLATTIMICATITVLQQHQIAQAFPCVGDGTKEYCTGYHDGAIQAHRDYNTGHDLDVRQYRCTGSADYCNGYNRGYSDEADFLG
jgi:hypothetical protein